MSAAFRQSIPLAFCLLPFAPCFLPIAFCQLPFVNPFIGTDAHGHTYPGATAPFGLVQLSPDTRRSMLDWDGCSGYHWSDSLIYGFSHTHLSGTGVPDYADVLFMPFTGKTLLEPEEYASPFQKVKERAEAGYYTVFLEKDRIKAELTATEHVGMHRYTFPRNREQGHLLIDLRHRDQVLDAELSIVNDHEIAGYRISKSWAPEQHVYFVARFSRPFFNSKNLDMVPSPHVSEKLIRSKAIVTVLDFYLEGEPLVVTVGISGTSIEGARRNLEAECAHFDFDKTRRETQEKWTSQLAKIEVEGGTEAQKTAFYTALYHTMIVPNTWSDVDGQYRGRDQKIHPGGGDVTYSVFSLWDTYRAANPLYTLLEPQRTQDFIRTFLRQYEQGGLLPVWELSANETNCMIGNHAIPVIVDAYRKGLRGFDAEAALVAMQKSVMQATAEQEAYRAFGYVTAESAAESVSKTLEFAYDDWCIAQMAKALGQDSSYRTFIRRAQWYKNIFDPSTKFFRAKHNSTWHSPFDPFEVNFNYTEANAWQYRFAVPQDVNTLMRLFGGREAFAAQLDSLFTAHPKTTGREQADITGLIGQYVHGNEPSHHMAYLYAYAGQPWKTQQRVRQIMDEMYSDRPDGLSGNEDCGQMSAWLVLSALGFYPVVPGSAEYVIGTPWFERATVHLGGDKTFTVRAPGASAKNCYIRKAIFDGKDLSRSWFTHDMLIQGGELNFEMGAQPSTWATAEADCPHTEITDEPIVPTPFVKKGERAFRKRMTVELGCLDPKAEIWYILTEIGGKDAKARATAPRMYKGPLVPMRSVRLDFWAKRGDEKSAMATATFSRMPENIESMQYNTQYSPQYTAGGDLGLVDGLRGNPKDFRTGGWQGYEGKNLDVVFDLGKTRTLHRLNAGFLQDENAWIFFPQKVQFLVSDDGAHFKPVGEVANEVPVTAQGTLQKDFTFDLKGEKARFVKVVGVARGQCPEGHKGEGNPCWIFVDEVEVE